MRKLLLPLLLVVAFVAITFYACRKYDNAVPAKYAGLSKQIAAVAEWYDAQLLSSKNKQAFSNANHPQWSNTKIINSGDLVKYTTLVYQNNAVTRELQVTLLNGVYSGEIHQYDFLHRDKDSILAGTFTLNGRFIERGYIKGMSYHQQEVARGRNIVLMGEESVDLPPVTVTGCTQDGSETVTTYDNFGCIILVQSCTTIRHYSSSEHRCIEDWRSCYTIYSGRGCGESTTPTPPPTGSGTPPPTYPPPPPPPPPPANDPCAEAAAIAGKLNNIFQKAGLVDAIQNIPNLSTEQKEQGFAIIEKRTYDPYDNTKYTSTYSTTPVQKSPDATSITVSVTLHQNEYLVGVLHTHPSHGAAGASTVDIYNMAQKGYEYITNAMNPDYNERGYIGNFMVGADGSIYGVAVSNPVFAYNFFNTKSQYLNTTNAGWIESTTAGKLFRNTYEAYLRSYDGNSNKTNLAFEAAQAEVLNKLNTGLSMVKYNTASGKFEGVSKQILPKKDGNGNQEYDANGNPKTTAANRCP